MQLLLYFIASTLIIFLNQVAYFNLCKLKRLDNTLQIHSVRIKNQIDTSRKYLSIMTLILWMFYVYVSSRTVMFSVRNIDSYITKGYEILIPLYCIFVPLISITINFWNIYFKEAMILSTIIGTGYLSYFLASL